MSKRIGVVFPGYGEQFIGMGKDLYDQLRIVQEFFEQAAGSVDINFVKLCFASSAKEIALINNAYLSIYLFECSLYEILYQKGLRPDFIAGHGIGEYTACFASKSLSFIDGLYFINKYSNFYSEFIKKNKTYTVLKITKDFTKESLEKLIDQLETPELPVYISAQNSQNSFYVAGAKKTIKKIQTYCKQQIIRKVKNVGPGYELHCTLVDEIVNQLNLYYHKIQFKALTAPIITNVDGVYVTTPDALQSAMMRKINNKIQWLEVMKGFEGCDVILSVGPGKQLIEWFKEIYPEKEYFTISTIKDIEKISHLLSEEIINSSEIQVKQEQQKDLHEADLINELPSDYDIESEEENKIL